MAIEETITVDAGPAISALNELAGAADGAAAAMDKVGRGFSAGSGLDKMAASMDAAAAKMQASAAKMQASMDRLASVGNAASSGLEKVGASAESSAGGLDTFAGAADKAAAAQDRLARSADATQGALDKQAVAGDRAAASADAAAAGAGRAAGSHSKLKEYALGSALTLGYAVDQAMKFNSEMTLLNTQARVPQSWLPQLTTGVLQLAGATGQSPGNLAESLYHVASNMASLPGASPVKMLEATKVAAEGASVGHSNLVDTTTALTSVLASGIPGAQNYSQAMGVINATVGSGEMNMQDLAEAMSTGVVPVVKGYGLTLKDVGAALADYGDLNIRGAKAGTELRMAVQALAVPAAAGKKELNALGLSTTSLAKDMQSGGLLKALDDLQSKFKANGITAKNEGQVITDLFGKKAGAGLALLLENMDRVQSKYPALTAGANQFGQAWADTLNTPQQKLKNLEAGAQAMAITFGNIAMPAASAIMGGLDKAMSWVQGHAFASKGLTVGLGALIAGGLSKGIFSGIESGLSGLGRIGSALKIPGLSNLANIGQGSGLAGAAAGLSGAGTGLDGAASALSGAAAELSGAAASLEAAAGHPGLPGTGARPGEPGGGTPVPVGGPGEKKPPVKLPPDIPLESPGALSRIKSFLPDVAAIGSAFNPIIAGVAAALTIRGIGDSLAPRGTTAGNLSNLLQKPDIANPANANPGVNHTIGGYLGDFLSSQSALHLGSAANSALQHIGSFFTGPQMTSGYPAGLGPFGGYTPSMASQNIPGAAGYTVHPGGGPTRNWVSVLGNNGAPATQSPWASGSGQLGAGSARMSAMATTSRIPGPDTSALEQARAKVQHAMDQISGALAKAAKSPGKIAAPDISAMEQAKNKLEQDLTKIQADLGRSMGAHPAKIPAPDLSAITSGAAQAKTAARAIVSAVDDALSKPAKAAAPDLSAYTSAAGPALADGIAVGAGFADGIASQAGAVSAAAASLAQAATAAFHANLQIHSPSKVTTVIGEQTGQGLADGITKSTAHVKAAAIAMSASTVTSLEQGLQGGKSAIDAALQAITGKGSRPQDQTTIASTITTLENDVATALKKGVIGKAEDSALVRMLKGDQSKLEALAGKRAQLEQEITSAQQIATSAISGMSITGAGQYVPAIAQSNGPQSAQSTINGMQMMAADQGQFASQLQQLAKMGLNSQSLSQLAQAGAQAGLPIAEGITQGGKGAVAQINALEAKIVGAAGKIGDVGGPAMYAAGQQVTAGLASGLSKQLAALDAAMTKMADQVVAIIKKELKIKSPSQRFADEVGAMIPAGVAVGVRGGTPGAVSAVEQMGARMAAAGRGGAPGGSGGYGGSGGGDTHYHQYVTVNVSGHVMAQQDLVDVVQQGLLTKGAANWQAGIILPGKHS